MGKNPEKNLSSFSDLLNDLDTFELISLAKPFDVSFYERDTVKVAKEILGSLLIRELNGTTLAGFIVEVEAYKENEEGCHAFGGVTPRCKVMFGPGGIAYIYFVYGMYWCLNATTEKEGRAGAVLIRAVEPLFGMETMMKYRKKKEIHELCSGPGKLTVAYALDGNLNGWDLSKHPFRILEVPKEFRTKFDIKKSARIGLKKAENLEYRFYVDGNICVSH